MTFYPGQKVVCVDADTAPDNKPTLLTKGATYTFDRFFESWRGFGVTLHEIAVPYKNKRGWFAERFRPVDERKTDISTFTEMLNHAGSKEPVC